jgi:hypothetical protein
VKRLDALHRGPHELLDAREPASPLLLADLEDPLLCLVEQLGGLGAPLERLADDRRRDLDQAPEERLFANDARVELDVGGRRDRVDEERDVLLAAAAGQLAASIVSESATAPRSLMAMSARKIRRCRSA